MRRGAISVVLALVASTVAVSSAPRAAGAAGPVISAPALGVPTAGAPTAVAVAVADPGSSPVELSTIVGFAAPVVTELRDDGAGADAVAGDGTYGGTVPPQPAGTLVRYRVVVGDATWPVKDGKRRHAGFVVDRPAVDSALPVLDWYLASGDVTWLDDNRASNTYVPAVLVVGGEVIDGVEVRNQGGVSNRFSPKPNYKFKLPGSVTVGAPFFAAPVDEFVADADREDPTSTLGVLAQELLEEAGVPSRMAATARVERNGAFFGVHQLYEEFDGTWEDRLGFPLASMYKADNGIAQLVDDGDPAALAERWEEEQGDGTSTDLIDLVTALDGSAGEERLAALVDRFDVPRFVDVLAMTSLIDLLDISANNLQLLRDGDSGRWRVVPNDLDLAFGSNGERHDFLMGSLLPSVTTDLVRDPALGELVARRLRSLADAHLGDSLVDRASERVAAMAPDLALDRAAWDLGVGTPQEGLAGLADFVDHQRALVAELAADGLLPPAQEPAATARLSEVRTAGDGGDFVELANPSTTTSVDLSGWKLTGAATAVLPGGTVLPAGGRLVVPTDPAAMAARSEGILVAGQLDGPLTATGSLTLADPGGASRDAATWAVGGTWPTPGSSGRSLEARTLDAQRAGGAGWVLSPAAGGTPGRTGASATGLEVEVWTPQLVVAPGTVEVRLVVTNRGSTEVSDVAVAGLGGACDLVLPRLAAGAGAVRWCRVTTPADDGSLLHASRLVATATSDQQPGGVVAGPQLVTSPLAGTVAEPEPAPVRLAPGRLDLTVGPARGPDDEEWRRAWVAAPSGSAPSGAAPISSDLIGPGPVAPVPIPTGGRARLAEVRRDVWSATATGPLAPPVTSRPSTTWPWSSARGLIDGWHRDLAGRPPTAGERSFWTAAIADGTAPVDLATHLLAQPRWATSAEPLVRLYLAHFGRVPDAGGLAYWLRRRWTGASVTAISQQFAASSEFARRYDGTDARQFVAAVYRNVFGRASDPGGLDHWSGRVAAGYPRGSVVVQFAESSEGVRRAAPVVRSTTAWFALRGTIAPQAWTEDAAAWILAGGDLGTVVESIRSDEGYAGAG